MATSPRQRRAPEALMYAIAAEDRRGGRNTECAPGIGAGTAHRKDTPETMERIRKDAVVVGLGAWGSATLWRLAARGLDVAGIEQYHTVHNLGSTHGITRIFRIACCEHPGLAPIALKSLELWKELSASTGEAYVEQIGVLNAGPPTSAIITGTLAAAEQAGVPVEIIAHDDLLARFPGQQAFGPDDVGVWDPWAGVAYPEKAVAAHLAAAKGLGAQIYPGTAVTDIEEQDSSVIVRTDTVEFEAKQVVIATGLWQTKLYPELRLRGRRVPLFWWRAKDEASAATFGLDTFPVFVREVDKDITMWGHGAGDDFGVKIGIEDYGQFTDADPDNVDRYVYEADIAMMAPWISKVFPELDSRPEKVTVCMYTISDDELFAIGRMAGSSRMVVAAGDSGHGFKHAAGLGEAIAQLVTDEEIYTDVGFMDPNRLLAGGCADLQS